MSLLICIRDLVAEQLRSEDEDGVEKERKHFWIHCSSVTKKNFFVIFLIKKNFFFGPEHSLWGHNSPTRDQTQALGSENTKS